MQTGFKAFVYFKMELVGNFAEMRSNSSNYSVQLEKDIDCMHGNTHDNPLQNGVESLMLCGM